MMTVARVRTLLQVAILGSLPLLAIKLFSNQLYFVVHAQPYLIFHNVAEFFSVMVALSIFGVAWYSHEQSGNRHSLFLGTAFLAVGLLDFMHALGYSGMPDFVTPNSPLKSTEYWIAGRFLMALALLASAYIYPASPQRWLTKPVLLSVNLAIPLLLFAAVTFYPQYVPATYIDHVGLTPFKTITEYLVIGLLVWTAAVYWRRFSNEADQWQTSFLAAFILCILSESQFTSYQSVFDTYNVIGHLYKIAAFYLFYLSIFSTSVKLPYSRIQQVNKQLTYEIAERKKTEATNIKLSLAVEQSPDSIIITDLHANIEYANAAFAKTSGYSLDEVIGKNPRILQSGRVSKTTYDDMWEHLARGDIWQGELFNRRKDGSEYIESALISPVRQADGQITHYLAIKEDITEKKAAEERINKLAHFDQLTGLPNRTLLQDHFKFALSLAQRSGESLAVMFLDLDHFKDINDTLGHSVGDQLLMEVARRIKASLREEDTVSRQGGDEFILILPGTNADGAAIVASKLMEVISRPSLIDQNELIITSSIGIAIYPHDGENLETLSKNAEAAMYRVKQDTRNDFRFFTQEMQARSARTLQLSHALRHALARNELQLHYQPQLSIKGGHVVGAEALLRWQHPELGTISPAEFIPIAEDSGQIIQIGEWVLRTATEQLKAWLDSGLPPMVVAVNLSAVQFRQANIAELITRIIAESKVPHEYLEVELTEAVAMDDPQSAIAIMDKLHDIGIRMSIDDFGTGYSSLSYLKKFKVYKLKIDQSFVRNLSEDPEDQAIVSTIINLASNLGLHTIAEGVETAGQLAFLRLQGCDEVQGYYFSQPQPPELFEQYLRKYPGSRLSA